MSLSYCSQLVSDISTIVGGVERIEGDQVTKATFYFAHAMVEGCDRVVGLLYPLPNHERGGCLLSRDRLPLPACRVLKAVRGCLLLFVRTGYLHQRQR